MHGFNYRKGHIKLIIRFSSLPDQLLQAGLLIVMRSRSHVQTAKHLTEKDGACYLPNTGLITPKWVIDSVLPMKAVSIWQQVKEQIIMEDSIGDIMC